METEMTTNQMKSYIEHIESILQDYNFMKQENENLKLENEAILSKEDLIIVKSIKYGVFNSIIIAKNTNDALIQILEREIDTMESYQIKVSILKNKLKETDNIIENQYKKIRTYQGYLIFLMIIFAIDFILDFFIK
ncbi:hypothetical protein OX284_014205 [Flavobacterium sp. SUN046]|uniref:hypothetical protein n=1 Tax=Flavobacterium sp. SUN046 TaxID=3002440 RepID=UPI002DB571C3|nr:hypothetical protein [Flavobacterium sp. SUN046]MEC4050588.1 hypothetical protein [Flavobacterium sp. SUN046]